MSSEKFDLLSIANMSECELFYRINKGLSGKIDGEKYDIGNDWYWNTCYKQLKERFGIDWVFTSFEYRDNMIAEYWLLHRLNND